MVSIKRRMSKAKKNLRDIEVERNLRHYRRVERTLFAHIYQQGMS
jgi:hypothetical protein